MAKAILFDLDGTLIDSAPDLSAAIDAVLVDLGYAPAGIDKVRAWVGNGAALLATRALAHAKHVSESEISTAEAADVLARFKTVYRSNCCHKSELYEGVIETLAYFAKQSYRMAIVTNKPYEFAEQMVNHYGLKAFCPVLIGGDSLPTKKPDPEVLYYAAKALNVPIENCVMVGDSKSDVLAAKAAGIVCYGLSYGYHRGDDLLALGAQQLLADFSKLQGLL